MSVISSSSRDTASLSHVHTTITVTPVIISIANIRGTIFSKDFFKFLFKFLHGLSFYSLSEYNMIFVDILFDCFSHRIIETFIEFMLSVIMK